MSDDSIDAEPDELEDLLAEALERLGEGEAGVLLDLAARAPQHAAALRRRLELLAGAGLAPGARPAALPGLDPRFTILCELGRGGMGVVWLARDAASGARVALKTGPPRLAATEKARERFRREVRAAAGLAHPALVPILAVGAAGDTDWFAMEYVEGATLAQVLAAARALGTRPGELDVDLLRRVVGSASAAHARAEIGAEAPATPPPERFGRTWVEAVCRIAADVADGLAHMHAGGVVHRDVKPANVLVDREGRARVFDLGLAHLADLPGITHTGELAGTPHYVAPEQASGGRSVDGRADVFALGVTLYELLTLRRPFEGRTTAAVLRAIETREPDPVRRHAPEVPRDLETIVLTALEKEPASRYAGAAEFAADLRRFLEFRPVRARKPGGARRVARFVRRRPAAAAAAALGLVVLVGTPLGLFWANAAIRSQRDRAERAAVEARAEARHNKAVLDFFTGLFALAAPPAELDAPPVSARELARVGTERAETRYQEDPLLRASLMEAMGRAWRNLGRADRAIPLMDRALAARERELGEAHVLTATVLHELARAHLASGDRAAARALGRRALAAFAAADEPDHAEAAWTRRTLAELDLGDGDLEGARAELEAALAIQRGRPGELDREFADTATRLGGVLRELGRTDAAEAVLAEALALRRRLSSGVDLDAVAESLELLGDLHAERGDAPAARAHHEEALGLWRKAYGDGDPRVGHLLARLCAAEAESARPEGPAGLSFPRALLVLARNQERNDAPAAAEATYRALVARADAAPEGADGALVPALLELGALCARSGRPAEAEPLFARARALAAAADPDGPDARRALAGLADSLVAQGRAQAADALHEAWIAALRARRASPLGAADPALAAELGLALDARARAARIAGRPADAERFAEAARAARSGAPEPDAALAELERRYGFGDSYPKAYLDAFQRGITALQTSRYADAEREFARCLSIEPRSRIALYNRACALARLGRVDPALDALARSIELGLDPLRNRIEVLEKDPDLAAVRADPRFPALVARMREAEGRARAHARRTELHVPEAVRALPRWPLVVVLHGAGETHDEVLAGPWRALADEEGFALLAPSGRVSLAADPADGMSWIGALDAYERRHWDYEEPVLFALDDLRREAPIDRERILLAGRGEGGMVAFNVAVHSPDVFRGVLVEQGTLCAALSRERARHLASTGTRVLVRLDPARAIAGLAAGVGEPALGVARLLEAWGVTGDVHAVGPDGFEPARRAAVRALLAR